MELQIKDQALVRALSHLAAAVADMTPAMDRIGGAWLAQVQLGFRGGTSPYGDAWAPPRQRSGQPLRDTGVLARSFTHQPESDEVVVGTNVCYAPPHQYGATITAGQPPHPSLCGYYTKGSPWLRWYAGGAWHAAKEVQIPARPFLPDAEQGMPEAWEQDALVVVRDWFLGPIE